MKLNPLIVLLCLAGAGFAAPQTFDFKDPKGINNAGFKLDAPLEAIHGSASGISGIVTFDPENPAAAQGKIVVASSSLILPNPLQLQHLQSAAWLDVGKYPEISFTAKELKNIKREGNAITADATGVFSLKAVSKELTVPVTMTYLQDKLGARVPNLKGDLLVIRANFTIKRSDFNLMPGQMEDKVANLIEINLSIAGASPK
jgi:polyisoprenoid-binding protein YceI